MNVRPRVCFLNRSYWPDTGATGQLLTELAEDLQQKHGFDVTVITGRPIGLADLPRHQLRNSVEIIRAAGTTFSPRRFAGRAANYLTYFVSACVTVMRLPRQQVMVAMTDPPIIALAALAFRRGAAVVWFCQDVFPEVATLLQDFRSSRINNLLDRITRFIGRKADRVIAIGETMAERLISGKDVPRDRLRVIHNWADSALLAPADKINPFSQAHNLTSSFVVLHAGNLGLGQNLDLIVEAADRLRDRTDITFVFIGDGTRRAALEAAVTQRALGNVRVLPYQPRGQIKWTYATADVCLVSLKAGLAGYIVPSKLYTILAAGRPYIAAVDAESEVATITEKHQCGVVVAPDDAEALTAVILRLAEDDAMRHAMAERAHAAAAEYDRLGQVAKHAALLEELTRDNRR